MVGLSLFKLMAVGLVSSVLPISTTLATALYEADFDIVPRATCPLIGYTSCNKNGLPSNFCCSSGQTCIAFNDNKSAICCPAGTDCKTIAPISCDIQKQNATTSPSSQLHSTDLTGSMEKCATACCPRGYSCQNSNCVISDASTTKSTKPTSSTSHSTSSATQKPTETTSAAATQPTAPSPAKNSTAVATHCNQFPAAAVLVGFFPGLILGALLTVATICIFGRRTAKDVKASNSSVFSSPAATVSDPIYQGSHTYRTDFLRREQPNMDEANGAPRRQSKVRSLFSRSPTTPTMRRSPTTPTMRKEPSMESIKIYSPPNMMANHTEQRNTTFSSMMQDAGFRAGEPYLGSPGKVDPRSRGVGG